MAQGFRDIFCIFEAYSILSDSLGYRQIPEARSSQFVALSRLLGGRQNHASTPILFPMTDTTHDYLTQDPAATDGLDDFFQEGLPPGVPEVLPLGVPVSEAANLLGVSERAVLKRLRRGTLKGFKVTAKRGLKWLVSKEELPDQEEAGVLDVEEGLPAGVPFEEEGVPEPETPIQATDSPDSATEIHYSSGLLIEEEGLPQEETGVPLSQSADLIRLVSQLQSNLDKANEQLQSACFRNGYLESKLEEKEREIKLLTDSQHNKPRFFSRLKSWFLGR